VLDKYDSDEETKKEMMTFDQRLRMINELDYQNWLNTSKTSGSTGYNKQVSALAPNKTELPIVMHEREIMENIENFVVTIVCGETGSGKSTQIPKFIYESQQVSPWKFYCGAESIAMVGITQPRRVAAVSLANRVSQELDTKLGREVGYQIRFDNANVSEGTKVKFMTDGILMKEVENDFMLSKYSCILVDEAHERSLNSDILVSLLTRIAHARCEMSLKERESKQASIKAGEHT